VFLAFAGFAHAQQLNIAVGGSTLWSPKQTTASEGYLPPAERGGVLPSASAQFMWNDHIGINLEGAFRYHEQIYNDFQPVRPIFYDVNGVYSSTLARKTVGDFMAGLGGESLLFYNTGSLCTASTGACRTYLNSNHFLFHGGVGIRYYFLRNFFVRPEAHYYRILNNYQFHSDNVFRVGASIGYTFGSR
jgi:hypothetical protein